MVLGSVWWGGLAFEDDVEVQRVAAQCIRAYDNNPVDEGALHKQSQRFLNASWGGLDGKGSCGTVPDPPLRHLMEVLASGEKTSYDFCKEMNVDENADEAGVFMALSKRSMLYWVSAFRLEPCLNLDFADGRRRRWCLCFFDIFFLSGWTAVVKVVSIATAKFLILLLLLNQSDVFGSYVVTQLYPIFLIVFLLCW